MRYSPSTGCFYPESLHYAKDSLPADIIEVSQKDFEAAMNRPHDTTFTFTKGGKLKLSPIKHKPEEVAGEHLKGKALLSLTKSDVVVLRYLECGLPVPLAWQEYRTQLRKVASGQLDELPGQPEF